MNLTPILNQERINTLTNVVRFVERHDLIPLKHVTQKQAFVLHVCTGPCDRIY